MGEKEIDAECPRLGLSTESQSRDRNATQENNRNIATDPRSVIAMLAELSKKRKVLADDQSETGSKRARREFFINWFLSIYGDASTFFFWSCWTNYKPLSK